MYPRLAAASVLLLGLVSPAAADMDVAGYLKAGGASILLWLIFMSALILAAALSGGKTRKALEALTIVWGFASFFLIPTRYGLLFILVGVTALTIGVKEEHKIRRALGSERNPGKTASILTILVVIIALSQMNLLRAESGIKSSDVFVTGFAKIQPVASSVTYKRAAFETDMANKADAAIKIDEVSIKESISGDSCTKINFPVAEVSAGKTLTIGATCPEKLKNEPYDLLITIRCKRVSRGTIINSIETGHIKKVKEENN